MRPYLFIIISIAIIGFGALLAWLAHAGGIPLLFPSGAIASAERNLMVRTVLLMLIVVIPVFILIIAISWKYRASNKKAAYTPEWEHSTLEEFIWWVIPFEIVLVLAAITWGSTHTLAPERAITNSQAPLTVQVVALPWKWLFIYPDEGVASMNELAIPAGRPIRFQLTADAPMNSFWIPALGGQEYAMSGMVTELNLIADHPGEYPGGSANYSGKGFAQMAFTAHALSSGDFETWVEHAKANGSTLSRAEYATLAKPSDKGPVLYYHALDWSFMDIVHSSMGMAASSHISAPASTPATGMRDMDMMH